MPKERLSSPERRRRILASKQAWKQRNQEHVALQHAIIKARPEYRAKDRERYKRHQLENAERTGVPIRRVGRPRLCRTPAELEEKRLRDNARRQEWRAKRKEVAMAAQNGPHAFEGRGAFSTPSEKSLPV